jgi:hypothetical protein
MSATSSPNDETGGLTSPPLNSTDEPSTPTPTPTNTTIEVPGPLATGLDALSLPITEKDVGIPHSPAERCIVMHDDTGYDEGYYSDGMPAPWHDVDFIDNEEAGAEEDVLLDEIEPFAAEEMNPENRDAQVLRIEDMMYMKVSELKVELLKQGLNQKGKKNELQARLKVGLESNVPLVEYLGEKEASNIAGDVFDPIAHWELLEQDDEVMNEVSMGPHLHAPTQPEGEIAKVIKKNYT